MKYNIYANMLAVMLSATPMMADTKVVTSPDGKLSVNIDITGGRLTYSVTNEGRQVMLPSALGLRTDIGDYTHDLTLKDSREGRIDTTYTMRTTKASSHHYVANTISMTFSVPGKSTAKPESSDYNRPMVLEMQVSNGNIAYRYHFDGTSNTDKNVPRRITILQEASAFRFPEQTTTFVCPQIDGNNTGWMGTKPSYEEEYKADAPMTDKSKYGHGYTFPCLFHETFPNPSSLTPHSLETWVLVSETGTSSSYCGCHLGDYDAVKGYTVAFPDPSENNGLGSTTPAFLLPGETPWRTITVGSTLKPVVETMIPFDVVEEKYSLNPKLSARACTLSQSEATEKKLSPQLKGSSRYTWSWLMWQDGSINYDDQVKFIDTASKMGYEYCLVDAWWDETIGRDRMAELSRYAQSRGVGLMLWYNSNGYANNAPQGPRGCMNTAIAREKEMSWLESIGVHGIKVDFFGGDKQETMQLYEDILSDANRHGIQVIFHGCTLPRGWERMYPNYVASEAVLASENVFFSEYHAKKEGFELTMHPFCRNAVASMDWGGTMMNRWLNAEDKPGMRHHRYTSDTFEMAAAIMNQTSVQCIDLQPSNLTGSSAAEPVKAFELDFLRSVPTTWQQTQFIDGYPTKYAVIARQSASTSTLGGQEGTWFVVGLNGENDTKTLTLNLPMFAGKTVTYYTDKESASSDKTFLVPLKQTVKVDKNGNVKVKLLRMGGFILCE